MKDTLQQQQQREEAADEASSTSKTVSSISVMKKVTIRTSSMETEVRRVDSGSASPPTAPASQEMRDPPPSSNLLEVEKEATDSPKEVDYDEDPTELYQLIESKKFKLALSQLSQKKDEANTWVVRFEDEDSKKIRWRMTCLHAAVVFQAPVKLVKALVEAAPDSVGFQDDRGMIPLHLAFQYNSNDEVLRLLLEKYPEGIFVKDDQDRIPIQCNAFFKWERSLLKIYAETAVEIETGKVRREELQTHEKILHEKLSELRSVQEEQLKKIEDSLEIQKAESKAAQKECVELLGNNQDLIVAGERLQSEIETLQSQKKESQSFVEELTKKLATKEAEISSQKAEIVSRDQHVEKLQNSAREKIEVCEQTSATLRKTVQDMCKAHKAVEADRDTWKKESEELSKYKPKCTELQRQVDILEDSISQLEKRLEATSQERQEWREKAESLLENNEALQASIAELTGLLEQKSKESEEWVRSYRETKTSLESTKEALAESTEEAKTLQDKKDTLEKDLHETREALRLSRDENASLQSHLSSTKELLEVKTSEYDVATGKIAKIEEEKDIECTFQEKLIMKLEVQLRHEQNANDKLKEEVQVFIRKVSERMDEAVQVIKRQQEDDKRKEEEEKRKEEEEKQEDTAAAAAAEDDNEASSPKEEEKETSDVVPSKEEEEQKDEKKEDVAEEARDEENEAPSTSESPAKEEEEEPSTTPPTDQDTPSSTPAAAAAETKQEEDDETKGDIPISKAEEKVSETLTTLTGAHETLSLQRDTLQTQVKSLKDELTDIHQKQEEEKKAKEEALQRRGHGWFVCGTGL